MAAVDVEGFPEGNDAAGQVEGAGIEIAILPQEPRKEFQCLVHEETAAVGDGQDLGIDGVVAVAVDEERGFGAGEFGGRIGREVVAHEVVVPGFVVSEHERSGIEVGPGARCDAVADAAERTGRERVVAIEEKEVFAAGEFDALVPGNGAGAGARAGEHAETRIARPEGPAMSNVASRDSSTHRMHSQSGNAWERMESRHCSR